MPTQVFGRLQNHQTVKLLPLNGLNDSLLDEEISRGELSLVENWIPDRTTQGVLIKRPGITQKQAVTEATTGTIFDGNSKDYFTDDDSIFDLSDGAALDTGLTSSTLNDWASFNSKDIFVNGTDARSSSNGTTWGAVSNIPSSVKYIESYHRFLFAFGHSGATVRWSNPEDETTWDASNAWTLHTDPTDTAKGMIVFRDKLMVFFDKSFYHLEGYAEKRVAITYSNNNAGTTSHRSLVVAPEVGLFWWTKYGPAYSPDGFSVSYPGMKKIPKTLAGLNEAQYARVHGIWDPNEECVQWWVCNGTLTTEDLSIRYYPSYGVTEDGIGSFWVSNGDGAKMAASGVIEASLADTVYVGAAAAGSYVFSQTGATDDSSSIEAIVEMKRDSIIDDPDVTKKMKEIILRSTLSDAGGLGIVGIYWDDETVPSEIFSIPFESTGFQLDLSKLDVDSLAETQGEEVSIYPRERYKKVKLRYKDTGSTQTKFRGFLIKGLLIAA
jgi:hypothetical protein